jgi:erythromycin esterase
MGFTIVAFEAPAPQADRINQYVQGGEGSLAQVVQDLGFKSWQTQEVVELIQWMRAYNQSHKQHIEFRGFDLQSQELPLQNLARFSHQQDTALLARVQRVSDILKSKPLTDSLRKVALGQVQEISNYLSQQKQAVPNDSALAQLQHDADILGQTIGLPLSHNRRHWMAQNIKWLVDNYPANTKFVIWAHNGHISKQAASMGHYLHEQYGKGYVAIGFTFGVGTYSVYGTPGFFDAEVPYPGTYEYLLGQAKYPNYLLPLSDLKLPRDGQWLKQTLGFRFLETESACNQFRYLPLANQFDAIIYMQMSQRSTYITP